MVADYDLIGEAAKSVSKAIWIGNVFAPFTCKEELEDTEAEAARRGRPPYLAEMESDFTVRRRTREREDRGREEMNFGFGDRRAYLS